MAKHGGHTASCQVIGVHQSSSSPLRYLQLPDIFGSVWVPDDARIFCKRSGQGYVANGLGFAWGIDGNFFEDKLVFRSPFLKIGQCDGSILGSYGYEPQIFRRVYDIKGMTMHDISMDV